MPRHQGNGGFGRPVTFPGAGSRVPQRDSSGGSLAGSLPAAAGRTGLTPFLSGRSSIKRSFQALSNNRPSPFFAGFTPTGLERGPQPQGFMAEEVVPAPEMGRKARMQAAKEGVPEISEPNRPPRRERVRLNMANILGISRKAREQAREEMGQF